MTLLRGPQPFFQDLNAGGGGWSQEIGPCAIYVSSTNKTIVAWYTSGSNGYKAATVAEYNHTTETWSERYTVGNYLLADDDHGRTALVRDASGYIHAFYGSHDNAQCWSSTNNPDDITSWTQHTSLSTQQTYPHPSLVGSVIYLLVRNGNAFPNNAPMAIRTCTPSSGAGSFSAQANIIDFNDGTGGRVYTAECYVVGTDIHFVSTRSNSTDTFRKSIYYFRYDTTTGALKNHDASVSTASGSLPINLTTANSSYRIYDHGTGQGDTPSFCIDAAGDPHVVFTDDNGTGGTSYDIKYMTRSGGVWSSPIVLATITDLFSGLAFNSFYTILPGASGGVEFWYMATGGNKLRRVRTSGGVWGSAETIQAAAPTMLLGSAFVRDAHANLRYLFAESAPLPTLDSGAITVKRFAHGDAGPIDAKIPSTAVDSLFASNVTVLLGFDHRDGATLAVNEAVKTFWTPTFNGNAQIDTAQSKFGGASLLLDGSGDFLTVPNNSLLSVSQGDFTIEFFVRRNASKMQALVTKRPGAAVSEFAAHITAANVLQWAAFNSSVAVVAIVGTTVINTGQWYHVELNRQGTTWRAFLDGNLEGSAVESATPVSNTTALHIGRDLSSIPTRDFNGWIDEFRFTSGVARHTANFTPPAAAYPRR